MQKNNYDVVIVGGGTSGCACAWNAAMLGLKTLLIEKNSYLGGAMTSQLVIPAMKTDSKGLNTKFYEELIAKAHDINAQITYPDGNPGWFNPLKLPDILQNMLIDVGVDVLFNFNIDNLKKKYIDTEQNDNASKIISLYIDTKHNNNILDENCIEQKHINNASPQEIINHEKIFAKYFVDATGNADFSEIAGAEFLPFEKSQALSLRFIMEGIDKKTFADWITALDTDRDVTTAYQVDEELHLSTACTWDEAPNWALKPIFDVAVKNGTLKDSDRAYFQVFSVAGEEDKIAFNCPRIMSDETLNPLLNTDMMIAKEWGKASIARLEAFCKKYLPGFDKAKVCKIADSVGIRESRRVKGEYVLTKEDIYNAKEFKSPVAYSNYPIDVHSVKRDDYTLQYVQKTYSVPLESLIVKGFSNLFVVGRCLSADFYAQAAVRIQPTCFSMGEAIAKHIKSLI